MTIARPDAEPWMRGGAPEATSTWTTSAKGMGEDDVPGIGPLHRQRSLRGSGRLTQRTLPEGIVEPHLGAAGSGCEGSEPQTALVNRPHECRQRVDRGGAVQGFGSPGLLYPVVEED